MILHWKALDLETTDFENHHNPTPSGETIQSKTSNMVNVREKVFNKYDVLYIVEKCYSMITISKMVTETITIKTSKTVKINENTPDSSIKPFL